MRETVCIVLNERESQKTRTVELLQNALSDLGITSSRMEVCEDINQIILQRLPQVLVLDYLLGDYSTGLDVLTSISGLPEGKRPRVFFLTDEPSVQVAVEAMRLGACNYFEIDNPQSVSRLTREIQQIAEEKRWQSAIAPPRRRHLSLDQLTAQARSSRTMIEQARAFLLKAAPVIIVHGTPGSGSSTLAQALLSEAAVNEGFARVADLATSCEPMLDLLGLDPANNGPRLGADLSVLLEHAEEDTGELLDLVSSRFNRIWRKTAGITACSRLILCSSEVETAKAWKKLLPETAILRVPPLDQRLEDLPALVQYFVEEAAELSGQKIARFDGELISWINSVPWPGQIRQLRSVIIDAAVTSTFSSKTKREIITACRELWDSEASCTGEPSVMSPLTAASALELCGHDYRLAAARLGCSTRALLKIVSSTSLPG